MIPQTLTNSQIQQVIDSFSLGKLLQLCSFGVSSYKFRDQEDQVIEPFIGKTIVRKNTLDIGEMVIKTSHGVFFIVYTAPAEEHRVFYPAGHSLTKIIKKLHITNCKLVPQNSPAITKGITHKFDLYFYVFSL